MLKHLDYLMISNGGCDPFHYLKGRGGLGYKPSPPFMHGLGYDYNLIDGMGIKGQGWDEEFNELSTLITSNDKDERVINKKLVDLTDLLQNHFNRYDFPDEEALEEDTDIADLEEIKDDLQEEYNQIIQAQMIEDNIRYHNKTTAMILPTYFNDYKEKVELIMEKVQKRIDDLKNPLNAEKVDIEEIKEDLAELKDISNKDPKFSIIRPPNRLSKIPKNIGKADEETDLDYSTPGYSKRYNILRNLEKKKYLKSQFFKDFFKEKLLQSNLDINTSGWSDEELKKYSRKLREDMKDKKLSNFRDITSQEDIKNFNTGLIPIASELIKDAGEYAVKDLQKLEKEIDELKKEADELKKKYRQLNESDKNRVKLKNLWKEKIESYNEKIESFNEKKNVLENMKANDIFEDVSTGLHDIDLEQVPKTNRPGIQEVKKYHFNEDDPTSEHLLDVLHMIYPEIYKDIIKDPGATYETINTANRSYIMENGKRKFIWSGDTNFVLDSMTIINYKDSNGQPKIFKLANEAKHYENYNMGQNALENYNKFKSHLHSRSDKVKGQTYEDEKGNDITDEKLNKYAENLYNDYMKYFNKYYKNHQSGMPYYPLESKELFEDFKRVTRLENVRQIDNLKKNIKFSKDKEKIKEAKEMIKLLKKENLYMNAFNLLPPSNSGISMGFQKIGINRNFIPKENEISFNTLNIQNQAYNDFQKVRSPYINYNNDGTILKIVNKNDEEKTFKPTFFKKSTYKGDKYLKDENLYNQSKLFEGADSIFQISTPEGIVIVPVSRLIREGKLDPSKPFDIYKIGTPSYGDKKKSSGNNSEYPLRINPDHMYMLKKRNIKKKK